MNPIHLELQKGINDLKITYHNKKTEHYLGRIQLTEHWVIIYNHDKATMLNGHDIKKVEEIIKGDE